MQYAELNELSPPSAMVLDMGEGGGMEVDAGTVGGARGDVPPSSAGIPPSGGAAAHGGGSAPHSSSGGEDANGVSSSVQPAGDAAREGAGATSDLAADEPPPLISI